MTRLALLLTVCGLALLPAAPAAAHAYLVASDPPDGATVVQAPAEVRFEFNEPVGAEFAQVHVSGPDGARTDVGEPVVDGAVVTQALDPLAAPGVHTIAYRVVSADGHPIEGSLTFDFSAPAPDPAPDPAEEAPVAPTAALDQAGRGVVVGLIVTRFANYLALAAVIGFLISAVWLLADPHARGLAARLGSAAAAVWLLSGLVLFVLALANAAALPVAEALDGARLAAFAGSRFGSMVLGQALLAGVVAALALGGSPRASRAALLTAGAGALAPGLWGHAATADLSAVAIVADWIHVLGAGAWVGGLGALVLLASRETGLADAASRFSRLAGFAIVAVGLSGLVHVTQHTGEVAHLTGTSWGRLALVKAGLLVVLGGFGWIHRRRTLPGVGEGRTAGFRRFAGAELGVMLVAIGLAATMAQGMPADVEAAARIKSLATPFGEGHLNLVVDPGVPGPNEIHLYFFGPEGDPAPVTEPSVIFEGTATASARLFTAGPGHYVDPRLEIPAGTYRVVVSGSLEDDEHRATATVTLP